MPDSVGAPESSVVLTTGSVVLTTDPVAWKVDVAALSSVVVVPKSFVAVVTWSSVVAASQDEASAAGTTQVSDSYFVAGTEKEAADFAETDAGRTAVETDEAASVSAAETEG